MKEKRLRYILMGIILFLLVSLVGSIWLLKEEKAVAAQQSYGAENQYQRSFWELSSSVETLNIQLAQLLVTTSREQTLLGLAGLWREVYNAINYLGGFPVAMNELENTDLLLNDVAEYSYYLMRKTILQEQPLAEKDWLQLEDFYRRSQVVNQELTNLGTRILNEDLRLQDLHEAQEDNVILATFHSIENQIHAFPELKFEEGVRKIEPEPRVISGKSITGDEAIQQADLFLDKLGLEHTQGKIQSFSENSRLPIYTIVYAEDTQPIYVEVSQKGGHILQFYQYRPVDTVHYTLDEAWTMVQQLLQDLRFPPMALVDSQITDGIADLTIVPKIDGIYIYADMVNIQVALDNNTLLNYDQTSYASRHYDRELPSPRLSKEDILKDMNPHFQIEDIRLALITDEYSVHELLAYEVIGNVVEEDFSIFVDAQNGRELRIVRR
ncbi:MAG: germination protein YpeB [Peptococcaceae bacterium]|nr:germination protein YpeB [Peptococcaceae bacterium]